MPRPAFTTFSGTLRQAFTRFFGILLATLPVIASHRCKEGEKHHEAPRAPAQPPVVELASFRVPNPRSEKSLIAVGIYGYRVFWATDDIVLVTAGNRTIQAFSSSSGNELWRRQFGEVIPAVTASPRHVFFSQGWLTSEAGAPRGIRRLGLATGRDSANPGVSLESAPDSLIWMEAQNGLFVLNSSEAVLFSEDLQTARPLGTWDGLPFVSHAGKFVLLAERTGRCALFDLDSPGVMRKFTPLGGQHGGGIDTPFLSNAFHAEDGGLIRVVDNSWLTGRICFHPKPDAEATVIDSENGHAVAAVHWPTSRLAISGTEKNLLLLSTSGQVAVRLSQIAADRVLSLDFSPSGQKLAALSGDGRVKIFEVAVP